jgi:hypothetical protein
MAQRARRFGIIGTMTLRALTLSILVSAFAPSAAPARAWTPVFQGCLTGAQVRPKTIVVACGDGNFFITGLRWATWAPTAASAIGTGRENDCKPYCAAGHFHTYPIVLRLSRPEPCSNGRTEYTRFRYRFTSAKPTGQTRWSSTLTSPFESGVHCR